MFAKWDYFPPRGVLGPMTGVMKSVSLLSQSQEAGRHVPLPVRHCGVKRVGVGLLLERLVALELGLKAHPVSKEMGRKEAFAERAPGSLPDRRFACR